MIKIIKAIRCISIYISIISIFALSLATNINCQLYRINPIGTTQLNATTTSSCSGEGQSYAIKITDQTGENGEILLQVPRPAKYIKYAKDKPTICLILNDNKIFLYNTEHKVPYLTKSFNIKNKEIKSIEAINKIIIVAYHDKHSVPN